jgi:hypothetical protein
MKNFKTGVLLATLAAMTSGPALQADISSSELLSFLQSSHYQTADRLGNLFNQLGDEILLYLLTVTNPTLPDQATLLTSILTQNAQTVAAIQAQLALLQANSPVLSSAIQGFDLGSITVSNDINANDNTGVLNTQIGVDFTNLVIANVNAAQAAVSTHFSHKKYSNIAQSINTHLSNFALALGNTQADWNAEVNSLPFPPNQSTTTLVFNYTGVSGNLQSAGSLLGFALLQSL